MNIEKPPGRKGFVYRFSSAIDNALRKLFFRVGYFVAGRPLVTIAVAVLLTLLCLIGMLRFRSEGRSEKLWVPQGTVALDNLAFVNQRFGQSVRVSDIVFSGKSNPNIASKAAMLEMLRVTELGFNVVGPNVDGTGNVTFSRACVPTFDRQSRRLCSTFSAFDFFYNASTVVVDANNNVDFFASIRKTLQGLPDDMVRTRLEEGPFLSASGAPLRQTDILGGITGTGSSFSVKAMRYTQIAVSKSVVENGQEVDETNLELEKVWTNRLMENPAALGNSIVAWNVQSAFSQSEALDSALSGDLPLFSIGFILLTIYVVMYLGDFHAIRSRQVLGLVCLVNAGLALGATFGISSALGLFFGPVHQVLPLLIVGIGVDDVFVVTRSLDELNESDKFKEKPVRTRIALALSNAGSAITVTSITNIIVFLLGAISKLPALSSFAFWAAIGVAFDWLFTVTFYTAALTLDTRRQHAKRRDCCPCFSVVAEPRELNWFKKPPGGFTRFFKNTYGPFIMQNYVRMILITIFLVLFGVCIFGCTQLYLKFEFSFFYPKGSAQYDYQEVIDENFKTGDPAPIYLAQTDITTPDNQRKYIELCHPETGVIATNQYIEKGTVDCWYHRFRQSQGVTGNNVIAPNTFLAELKTYLDNDGVRYKRSINFTESGGFDSAKFDATKKYTSSNREEIDALLGIREAADSVGFGADANGNPKAFTFSFGDTFTEQYKALPEEIALSLGLASAAVAIICFQLVGHPVVALVSVMVVGMTIIDVLGFTFFTGVNINSVSVTTIVIATGIAVDYVVHIARSFLEQVGETRTERAIAALGALGPPVFYAGFSTFLAIICLALATSYIFNVLFLGFLELILIGLAHGLIFSPLILSLIGPAGFYATHEEKEMAEDALVCKMTGEPKDSSDFAVTGASTSTEV